MAKLGVEKLQKALKGKPNSPDENGVIKYPDDNFPPITTDINSIIEESFGDEEGILEIFKGVYKHAKGGSVPHATFIMNWYFKDGEGGEEIKEFRIIEEVVE